MTLLTRSDPFSQLQTRCATLVKTCGMMQVEHALAAADAGADMIGVVLAPSKRLVSVEVAAAIREGLETHTVRPLLVGVFVNEQPTKVLAMAHSIGLDIIQMSGNETPQEVADCARQYPVLKALRFAPGTSVEAARAVIQSYRRLVPVERMRFLVDTYHPGEYGGTGMLADWGIASELAEYEDIVLAGGLTPGNIAQAIAGVRPWGVDVSSGIEREGVKDPKLIRAFIEGAQQAIPN